MPKQQKNRASHKSYASWSKQDKEDLVALTKLTSIHDVSRKNGVAYSTLRGWVVKVDEGVGLTKGRTRQEGGGRRPAMGIRKACKRNANNHPNGERTCSKIQNQWIPSYFLHIQQLHKKHTLINNSETKKLNNSGTISLLSDSHTKLKQRRLLTKWVPNAPLS